MHPSYYPFVRNGPDCACTHRRVRHVGVNEYGFPSIDRGCADCAVCERYAPLESIDHDLEDLQRDEILVNEQRRTAIHRRVTLFMLGPLFLIVAAAVWAPHLVPWLLVVMCTINLSNLGIAGWHNWRTGDMDTGEAVSQVGLGVGVIAFLVALALGATVLAYVLLGIAFGFAAAFALVTQRWLGRSMRAMGALQADLKRQQDEP